jgi:hypothetical protein
MTVEQVLGAKYHARHLADHAMLVHYADNFNVMNYHAARMHEAFLELADEMGYDVVLRSAEQEQEAA